MVMNEVRIPIVLKFSIENMVIVLRATLIKEAKNPYILVQIEPLYH